MPTAEYMREYRARNYQRELQRARNYREQNRERITEYNRKYHRDRQDNDLSYVARKKAYMAEYFRDPLNWERQKRRCLRYYHEVQKHDPVFREQNKRKSRAHYRQIRKFALAAREELRSLMAMGPRTSKLIRGYIDIESASDAEVVRFYRKLMEDLKNGHAQNKRR